MWKCSVGVLWLLQVNVPRTWPQPRALGRALAQGGSVDRSAWGGLTQTAWCQMGAQGQARPGPAPRRPCKTSLGQGPPARGSPHEILALAAAVKAQLLCGDAAEGFGWGCSLPAG